MAKLADECFERMILGRWKYPSIVRSRIDKDIKPSIGRLRVEDVKPLHIDAMLQKIVKRGAPTIVDSVPSHGRATTPGNSTSFDLWQTPADGGAGQRSEPAV
ncbi:phage integrase central domain-containing protein [Methylomagnum ishizawai]|uniref:phage integrase central domain-containing protein n=1 Tax=Methylomagnum ishizawai TaxID=1760988 RepID=UPI001C7E433D|nr:hypothetical protein [Methylomagnum ishizawai]